MFAGYQLTPRAMETILKRYSRAMDDGRVLIAFDDFVSLSVRLRAYTGMQDISILYNKKYLHCKIFTIFKICAAIIYDFFF